MKTYSKRILTRSHFRLLFDLRNMFLIGIAISNSRTFLVTALGFTLFIGERCVVNARTSK